MGDIKVSRFVLIFWACLFIFVGLSWLSWHNSYYPVNAPLCTEMDQRVFGGIVHQTGSLIAVMASFIITVLGFVAPFILSLWSAMSDSYFQLFLMVQSNTAIDEVNRERLSHNIKTRLYAVQRSQTFARSMFITIICMSIIGSISVIMLAYGLPYWHFNEYHAIRSVMFTFYIIFPIPILLIIILLIRQRPDAYKRELQVEIMRLMLKIDCDEAVKRCPTARLFRCSGASIIKSKLLIYYLLPIPVFLLIWEGIARSGIYNITLLPPPSYVLQTLLEIIRSGELRDDLVASVMRAGVGFAFGTVVGIFLGFLTGCNKTLSITIGQLINLFRPVPPIAIIPLVMLVMGIGEGAKCFIVFWGVLFPVWLNTHVGITKVDQKYTWAAKSLGASDFDIFYEVILPAASPFIVAGARIGMAIALMCLVAAEMAAASEGLGFRITYAHLVFRPDKVLANLIVLGVLGAVVDRIFVCVRNRLLRWYKPD